MTSVLPISPSCKSDPNSVCEDYLSKRSNGPGGLRLGCFGVVKMPPLSQVWQTDLKSHCLEVATS